MGCIDKNLTDEQVEERIDRYIHNRMDEDEELSFAEHLCECDYCERLYEEEFELYINLRRHLLAEEIEKAKKAKEWQKVQDLYKDLQIVGYSEEDYPVKDMVTLADQHLTYDELCEAYKKGLYETAKSLHKKMESLDYDEEKFPIKKMLIQIKHSQAINRSVSASKERHSWLTRNIRLIEYKLIIFLLPVFNKITYKDLSQKAHSSDSGKIRMLLNTILSGIIDTLEGELERISNTAESSDS